MASKLPGLFVKTIDWSDPEFAPYNLQNVDLNEAQLDAFLDAEITDECSPDLTEEEQKELCLSKKIKCKVELFHSNVCKGVEKGWPKRMFKKATFDELDPKEKRCIYRNMVKKAVLLYEKYVDEKRLADRCRRRTSRALAPYYELRYRKNLFERIKSLGSDEPAPGYDATIEQSVQLDSDSEVDEADEAEASQMDSMENSMDTVINTGKTGTQKSNEGAEEADVSDCHSDVMSENTEYRNAKQTSSNWVSKTTYTITQNGLSDDEIIASEYEVSSTSHYEYNVEMSEGVSATPSRDTNSETQSQQGDHFNQSGLVFSDLVLMTPMVNRASQRTNEVPDGATDVNEIEVDTLDFCTQEMDGRTSTQQRQQQPEQE